MFYDPVFLAVAKAAQCKNLFFRTYERTETVIGVTFWWDAENQEFVLNGTTTAPGDLKLVNPMTIAWEPGEKYTVTVTPVGGTATLAASNPSAGKFGWGVFQNDAAKFIRGQLHYTDLNVPYTFTAAAFAPAANKHLIFYFQCWQPGTVFDNYRVKVQIEKGEASTKWTPYRTGVSRSDLLKRFRFIWHWFNGEDGSLFL